MPVRHELLAAAVASSNDAVVLTDASGRICELNPAAARLFGLPADAARGQPLDALVRFQGQRPAPAGHAPAPVTVLAPAERHVLEGTLQRVQGGDDSLGEVLVVRARPDTGADEWRRLLCEASALSCIVGTDGYFKEVGEQWFGLLGHPPEVLLTRPVLDMVHPDDRARTAAEIRRLGRDGVRTVAFESRYLRADGGSCWLSWYAVIDPQRQRVYAFANDVTDVKRQERLLYETQGAARVGGWALDLLTGALYWTDETYRIHDVSPETHTPTVESALGLYTEESACVLAAALQRAVEHGEPFELEAELVMASGRRIWCRNIAHVEVEDGKPVRVYGSCQDITEQRRNREALRASEERLRALVRDIGIGVLVHGPGGEVLHCNHAALDALGVTEDQLLGRTSFDPEWHVVHEDGTPFPEAEHPVSRAIATGRSVTGVIMGVYRPRTRDRVWLLVNAVIQPDERVEVGSVVCSFTDITARKRAEDAARESDAMRKRMEAQLMLADRLTSLGTMAAGVAHEINNPLTWLMGNVSYVLETLLELRPRMGVDDELFDDVERSLVDSLSGADRIRTIVQDLRLFARTKEDEGGTTDILQVLRSTLRMLHNELSHRVELTLDLTPVPEVCGDEARLGQVLTNLLVNAIQALPGDRRHGSRVLVRVARDGAHVIVEVRDNGKGIPPEVRDRIFDPFFTTKGVGQGTGLGLSICHSIVTHLGGRIEVFSEPGAGATFRVYLRCADRPAAAGEAPAPAPPEPSQAPPPARTRILCVDDEPDMRDTIARMLGRHYDVAFETDGARAMERIRAGERYDAILCDLMMPAMNGMELYGALRDAAPELAARCGFMTGGTFTPAARAFAEALPPARLLEKPFGRDAIRALVARLLDQGSAAAR